MQEPLTWDSFGIQRLNSRTTDLSNFGIEELNFTFLVQFHYNIKDKREFVYIGMSPPNQNNLQFVKKVLMSDLKIHKH